MGNLQCRICLNETGNTSFSAREMMFGSRDLFTYIECDSCGAVQIATIPENIGKYYPDSYYSYASAVPDGFSFKNWRKGKVYQHYFGNSTLTGALLSPFSSKPPVWMKDKYLALDASILDVGCGSGGLLLEMQRGGFTQLTGVDPFIEKDIHYDSGITVFKKEFGAMEGSFDFIMFHHSFEHMDQPLEVFKHIHRSLKQNGVALIRIPVADSFSYRKYKSDWVNLDPPRHFFLHTDKSIALLAEQTGLVITESVRDANQFQFYGSELYKLDIPLEDYNKGLHKDVFSKDQIRKFRVEARRLNKINEGDWACYYLKKSSE